MQWLNVHRTQASHAMCLLASKQRAISFCGLNQNRCLSRYPAVLVRSHMAFLYSFSSWLTMFDCLKCPCFCFFSFLWDEAVWTAHTENQNCFLFPSTSLSLSFTISLFPSAREWTGQDRRELGCDVFRAAINKSALAHALWNPEPLYPFHVFPMSRGLDPWPPRAFDLVISGPREAACVYVSAGGVDRGVDYLMTPLPPPCITLPPIFISQAIKHTHTQTQTHTPGEVVQLSHHRSPPGPVWPQPCHRYLHQCSTNEKKNIVSLSSARLAEKGSAIFHYSWWNLLDVRISLSCSDLLLLKKTWYHGPQEVQFLYLYFYYF